MSPTAPTVADPTTFSLQEQLVLDGLLDALRYGTRVLARTLGQKTELDERVVRDIISNLRLKGVIIASDQRGFFIPRSHQDAKHTSNHLWSRVRNQAKVARAYDAACLRRWKFGRTEHEQIALVFGDEEITT